jgi:hypothetical protein
LAELFRHHLKVVSERTYAWSRPASAIRTIVLTTKQKGRELRQHEKGQQRSAWKVEPALAQRFGARFGGDPRAE